MIFVDFSGWIAAFTVIGAHKAAGAIMIIVAILFTICAVLSVILLKMVRLYLLFLKEDATFPGFSILNSHSVVYIMQRHQVTWENVLD